MQRIITTWKEQPKNYTKRTLVTRHNELDLYNISRFISSDATDVDVKLLRSMFLGIDYLYCG